LMFHVIYTYRAPRCHRISSNHHVMFVLC
jgi:hypothetical protein